MLDNNSSILALDVGGRRIGVAVANAVARIAQPLTTIENTGNTMTVLGRLVSKHQAAILVVGLPRGLNGQVTPQTRIVETFAEDLEKQLHIPIHMQDEAVTSKKAEAELRNRNKPYSRGDIDALAAAYILDDFLQDHPEVRA